MATAPIRDEGLPAGSEVRTLVCVPTADGRLTRKDREQIKRGITRLDRLVTGTLVPALERFPDDAEHWQASIDEAARIAETLKMLVIYDEQRTMREGPVDDDL